MWWLVVHPTPSILEVDDEMMMVVFSMASPSEKIILANISYYQVKLSRKRMFQFFLASCPQEKKKHLDVVLHHHWCYLDVGVGSRAKSFDLNTSPYRPHSPNPISLEGSLVEPCRRGLLRTTLQSDGISGWKCVLNYCGSWHTSLISQPLPTPGLRGRLLWKMYISLHWYPTHYSWQHTCIVRPH